MSNPITTHLAYCNSNVPVTMLSDALDNGVICLKPSQQNGNYNVFSGTKLTVDSNYFSLTTSSASSLIYTDLNNKIGQLDLPEQNSNKSFVISYGDRQYVWKDVNDLIINQYYVLPFNNVNNSIYTYSFNVNTDNIEIYDNSLSDYKFIALIDVDIRVDSISAISNIVKRNEQLFLTFNVGNTFDTNMLQNIDTLLSSAVNVTNTISPMIHVTKILQDISFSDDINILVTLKQLNTNIIPITNYDFDKSTNIQISGSITLLQYNK